MERKRLIFVACKQMGSFSLSDILLAQTINDVNNLRVYGIDLGRMSGSISTIEKEANGILNRSVGTNQFIALRERQLIKEEHPGD